MSRYNVTLVIPVLKLPVPDAVRVRVVRLVVLVPGLVNWNCRTGRFTPGSWVELPGE